MEDDTLITKLASSDQDDDDDDDVESTTTKTTMATEATTTTTTTTKRTNDDKPTQRGVKQTKLAESTIDENFCTCLRYLLIKMWCITIPPVKNAAKNLKGQLANELNSLLLPHNTTSTSPAGTGVGKLPVMRVFQCFLEWLSKHTNEESMCGLSASLHWSGGWLKSVVNNACAMSERFDTGKTILKGYQLSATSNRAEFQNLQKIGLCPFSAIEPILLKRGQTCEGLVADLEAVLKEKSLFTDILNPLDLIFKFFVDFSIETFELDYKEAKRLVTNLWGDDKKNEMLGYFAWDSYDFDTWPEYSTKNHLVALAKYMPQTMCVFAQPKIICDILAEQAPPRSTNNRPAPATTPRRTSASYSTRRTSARIQVGALQNASLTSSSSNNIGGATSFIVDDKFPPTDVDVSGSQLKRITSAVVDLLYATKPTSINIVAASNSAAAHH